jgi:hypothetical protein
MRLSFISLIGALIALVFIVAPTPALSEPDPAETLVDMFDSEKAPLEGGGTVAFDGCKRSEDGKSCSKEGCPKGYECLAAPDKKCTCIKSCGKIGGACGGGCPPGKVCVLSGSESESECKCEDPTLTCKPIDFPTPEGSQGRACGGECPPGLVCAGDPSKKGGCKCEAMTDPSGTCTFVPNNGEPYCKGNCPSGKGRCLPVVDDDGNWTSCKCQENCGDFQQQKECPSGECFFGAVCRYNNGAEKCECNPIEPTPTPTPGGDAECGIKISILGQSEWQDEDSIDEYEAKALRVSGAQVTCDIKSGQCPAGKNCKFDQITYGDCGCR